MVRKKSSENDSSFLELQSKTARIILKIGGTLFSFGILSFIVAHWNDLSLYAQTGLVTVGMALFYSTGTYILQALQKKTAGNTLIVLGFLCYGAALFLARQCISTHLYDSNTALPSITLLWAVGGLLTLLLTDLKELISFIVLVLVVRMSMMWFFYDHHTAILGLWSIVLLSILFYCLGLLYKKANNTSFQTICFNSATKISVLFVLCLPFTSTMEKLSGLTLSLLQHPGEILYLLSPLLIACLVTFVLAFTYKAFLPSSRFCLGGMGLLGLTVGIMGYFDLVTYMNGSYFRFPTTLPTPAGFIYAVIAGAFIALGSLLVIQHDWLKSIFTKDTIAGLFSIIFLSLFLNWATLQLTHSQLANKSSIFLLLPLIAALSYFCSRNLFAPSAVTGVMEITTTALTAMLLFIMYCLPELILFKHYSLTQLLKNLSFCGVFVGVGLVALLHSLRNRISLAACAYKSSHMVFVVAGLYGTSCLFASFSGFVLSENLFVTTCSATLLVLLLLHVGYTVGVELKSPFIPGILSIALLLPVTTILTQKSSVSFYLPFTLAIATLYLCAKALESFKEKSMSIFCSWTSIGLLSTAILWLSTRSGLINFSQLIARSLLDYPLQELYIFIPLIACALYHIGRALFYRTISKTEITLVAILVGGATLSALPYQHILFKERMLTSYGFFWAVLFNVLLFVALMSIILLGYRKKSLSLINWGAGLLFITIIIKYFNWVFSALSKTTFFMISGLILIIVGYSMEKGRAYLIESLTKRLRKKS